MIIFWKIRYLNRSSREFADRYLYVDTDTLELAIKSAIEFVADLADSKTERRGILKFRSLFLENDWQEVVSKLPTNADIRFVGPPEYFEDEVGKELTPGERAVILTGNPDALSVPHDIEFMLSEPQPLPLEAVRLSDEEIKILGYFVRDIRELRVSALIANGPGKLEAVGSVPSIFSGNAVLKTAVTDPEIRSFVTIFRRLYMENEPANFCRAVEVYCRALGTHPFAKWIAGVAADIKNQLTSPPEIFPFVKSGHLSFATKRLIDVFLYTQYAHQPVARRERQFKECLRQVNGQQDFLTWMFLTEAWKCSLEICNVGRLIDSWYSKYCECHPHSVEVLESLRVVHPGIGTLEKDADRRKRLYDQKVVEMAKELWRKQGCPESGPDAFLETARQALKNALGE